LIAHIKSAIYSTIYVFLLFGSTI